MSLDLSREATVALSVTSGAALIAFFVGVAIFFVRIPPDYFLKPDKPARSAFDWCWKIGKNLLGVVLVLAGAVMLPLPGPGSLVLVLGIALVDFPRRARLVRWIISRRGVARVVNWLRGRFGRPPLLPRPEKAREIHIPAQAK